MSPGTSAQVLDGLAVARRIKEEARKAAGELDRRGAPPVLRVVLLGNNPASEAYVASKTRAARECGCLAETIRLPAGSSRERLLAEVERGNHDDAVDGLLVQLPLEPRHDPRLIFDALDPSKDVDGLHPENVGLLHQGRPRFVPCTPAGILALLDAYQIPITGRRAVVLGRSEIVGKPVAALLTARDATVTLCHSKTRDIAKVCQEADLLIAAIGRPGFVTEEFVRPGAVVVDVGMNRLESLEAAPEGLGRSARIREAIAKKGYALVGDVDFERVSRVAAWITPVPGGIGPLTVAMLLKNTIKAARLRRGGEFTVESPEPMAES
ncbi:MAG TPA: bifunctional 5,10-methylenetetrahydrofolate dehydrogenase/5,10-methenyltetrahydrofolate cyclohydrolase [Thermoanaerobaculia bacterium]|nr:bifunctional 5,10-methylenetetrahydrofolate dehydrogenase/5,10-methenyltetrahydrofolate cyclohydrolase [Thermoanaerobaculia bacterium]